MDWLEFLEKVIGHLAWPAFTAGALFIMRDHLPEIVRTIKTLKLPGGIEVAFQGLRDAAATAKLPVPRSPLGQDDEQKKIFVEQAESYPVASILQDWQDVEREITDMLDKYIVKHPEERSLPSMAAVRVLYRRGIVDSDTLVVLHQCGL